LPVAGTTAQCQAREYTELVGDKTRRGTEREQLASGNARGGGTHGNVRDKRRGRGQDQPEWRSAGQTEYRATCCQREEHRERERRDFDRRSAGSDVALPSSTEGGAQRGAGEREAPAFPAAVLRGSGLVGVRHVA